MGLGAGEATNACVCRAYVAITSHPRHTVHCNYASTTRRAYPDMLMIGVQGQTPDESKTGGLGPWAGGFVQPTVTEQRTHFGLWCALSAPLTLSLDFANKSATDSVWDIITNKHAIAVNQVSIFVYTAYYLLTIVVCSSCHGPLSRPLTCTQAWAGHPGTIFKQSNQTVSLHATCMFNSTCDNHGRGAKTEVTLPAWQAWYKPLPGASAAIFVANHGDNPVQVTINFSEVPRPKRHDDRSETI